MISKKLLSEVLNIKVYSIKTKEDGALYIPNNCIGFEWDNNGYKELSGIISIYELIYKCKEWAWKQGYLISTMKTQNSGYCSQLFYMDNNKVSDEIYGEDGHIKDFVEFNKDENSDIKACEWILKNK